SYGNPYGNTDTTPHPVTRSSKSCERNYKSCGNNGACKEHRCDSNEWQIVGLCPGTDCVCCSYGNPYGNTDTTPHPVTRSSKSCERNYKSCGNNGACKEHRCDSNEWQIVGLCPGTDCVCYCDCFFSNVDCVLPFIYKQTTYKNCTITDSNLLWCSTKTKQGNQHVGENLAYCNQNICKNRCKINVEELIIPRNFDCKAVMKFKVRNENFYYFNEESTFSEAKEACQKCGWVLAHPNFFIAYMTSFH
ncbi:unnamed protein product, partial [Meganyctiphanes norvegica]